MRSQETEQKSNGGIPDDAREGGGNDKRHRVVEGKCLADGDEFEHSAGKKGMLRRNEKRAAASRVKPMNMPAVIVVPERDAQGINANAWAQPMICVSLRSMPSMPRRNEETFSATHITTARRMRLEEMT